MKAAVAMKPVVATEVIDDLRKLGRQLDKDQEFMRAMQARLDMVLSTNPAKHDH